MVALDEKAAHCPIRTPQFTHGEWVLVSNAIRLGHETRKTHQMAANEVGHGFGAVLYAPDSVHAPMALGRGMTTWTRSPVNKPVGVVP